MENSELNFKQQKLAFYVVGGVPLKKCADYLGLSEPTIYKYLKLPAVQSEIRRLRRLAVEHSTNELLKLSSKAVATLDALLDSENAAARCRAAAFVLDKLQNAVDFYEYESRLRTIEKNLAIK